MKINFNPLSQKFDYTLSQSDIVVVDTKANILATTPDTGKLAYATDTLEFYLYDGTNWKVAPLELETETATQDMGAYNIATVGGVAGLGVSDLAGYYKTDITDKSLHNIRLLENANTTEGSIRTTTSGVFQVYLNARWNTVVINFVLREDAAGGYQLEHAPIGFSWYYEVMSGNSDNLGLDGNPVINQYTANMGCYGPTLTLEGGSF